MRARLAALILAAASPIAFSSTAKSQSPSDHGVRDEVTAPNRVPGHVTRNDARVNGTVFDSITGAPLPGAVVQLVGRSDRNRSVTTRSDADGRFVFDSVAPGAYVAGFLHPRLDSLHLAAPLRDVTVPASGAIGLRLFVPSRRALVAAHCGPTAARDMGAALFLGRVRPASNDATPVKSTVSIKWVELTIDRGIRRQLPTVEAQTDASGGFAICGLPADTRLLVQAWSARDTSGLVELDMPADGLLLRDLHVGAFQSAMVVPMAGPDSTAGGAADSVLVLRGSGRLRGTIRTEKAMPVAGATVRVRGSESVATTDATGGFTLSSLPTGTHALEATAIGFQPARMAVDIIEADAPPADLVMRPVGKMLDTMRVFASRDLPTPWRARFEERRKTGLGRYLDEAAIEKRDPMTVTDLLSIMPGVSIRSNSLSSRSTLMVRATGGYCYPAYFIDGVPVEVGDSSIDNFLSAREVRAVELYRSRILTPSEFAFRAACGTIVIWTGMRKGPAQ